MDPLRVNPNRLRYRALIGTGGIGTGSFFALDGNPTLGREESRSGRFLENRDYAKLHIIAHYVQTLMGPAFTTLPIGKVGADEAGRRLRKEMAEAGLDIQHVHEVNDAPTMNCVCLLYPDGSGGNLTVGDSASAHVDVASIGAAESDFSRFKSAGIALAVPEVPLPARHELLALAGRYGFLRVASFTTEEVRNLNMDSCRHIDLLALNRDETAVLAGMTPDHDPADLLDGALRVLTPVVRDIRLIVTAGLDGSWTWDGAKVTHVPALRAETLSAAGAGDAFLAGILAGLASGFPLDEAQQLGTIMGSLSVTSPHTIHPDIDRVSLAAFANDRQMAAADRVQQLLGLDHSSDLSRFADTEGPTEQLASVRQEPIDASDVGGYHPFIQRYADARPISLSYLARSWPDRIAWSDRGRSKMAELLAYRVESVAPEPDLLETRRGDGLTRHRIRLNVTADRTTEAFLLIPDGLSTPAPAVVVLHDHGGFYYFGKEKSCETENPPRILHHHIDTAYGNRPLADELARHGFVVLAPDAFYFGSQRLDPKCLPRSKEDVLTGLQEGSDEYIAAFNTLALAHEEIVAKTLFDAGTTWPGVLFQGDRAAVDYLITRPEVDSNRIGCIGLSLGGFRSAHLFGLDSRMKAGVVAGWMTTYSSLLYDHLHSHTWMIYVPGQLEWLDLPDVATLNAPRPLMVANCTYDELFTLEGMQTAERKIADVYRRMNAQDRFCCRYDDEPHSFKIPAQDAAIAWLERWLHHAPAAGNISPRQAQSLQKEISLDHP